MRRATAAQVERGELSAPPLRPGRAILGMSAVLLPFTPSGDVDWAGFEALRRPHRRGRARPGREHGHRLRPAARRRRPARACSTWRPRLTGAAASWPAPSSPTSRATPFDLDAYLARAASAIAERGGTPVMFPSHGLNALADDGWVAAHAELGARARPLHRLRARRRCSCRTAASTRSTRTEALLGIAAAASAPSTRRCRRAAEWDRLARPRPGAARLPRVHRQRPRHRHGDVRLRLPARACRRSRPRRSPSATGAWAAGDPSLPRAQRPAPVPRPVRVPRPGARRTATMPRMFLAAAGLDRDRRDPARRAPAARRRPGRSSPTSPRDSRRCCDLPSDASCR